MNCSQSMRGLWLTGNEERLINQSGDWGTNMALKSYCILWALKCTVSMLSIYSRREYAFEVLEYFSFNLFYTSPTLHFKRKWFDFWSRFYRKNMLTSYKIYYHYKYNYPTVYKTSLKWAPPWSDSCPIIWILLFWYLTFILLLLLV